MRKETIERAACHTLTHLLDYDDNDLFGSDKPDIQSHSGKIGIEVRCDVYEDEQKINALATKYWGKELAQVPENAYKIITQLGGSVFTDISGKINQVHVGTSDNTPTHLIGSAIDKLKKLNSGGYTIFDENDLYLFVESMILETAESHIYTFMKAIQDYNGKIFDYVFLDQSYIMYICNIRTQTFKCIPIPLELRGKRFREES